MKYFELECQSLANLGGPMGSETTPTIFRKSFSTEIKAKLYAEEDHKTRNARVPIFWAHDGSRLYSGDLLSHDYTIREVEIE